MKKEIVVLLGGPSSGKTTLIKSLQKKGFTCYPEISRTIIKKAQDEGIDQLFLENPILFSELLLKGRVQQFEEAVLEKTNIVFIDRGIPDVVAYLNLMGTEYPADFITHCENLKYTTAFMLPPWEEIHITDQERYEDFEQAVAIHHNLKKTYEGFGYHLIDVPKDSVSNRTDFILKNISTQV